MRHASMTVPDSRQQPWRILLQWRWPLAGMIGLAFALGQVLEALLLTAVPLEPRLAFDIVIWGLLGASATWLSLTWASRQEQRYQAGLEETLVEQQHLNAQLQRANDHLALLSEVTHRLATSTGLDEIMDAALSFPRRLVPAQAAALLLGEIDQAIETRVAGASTEELMRWRTHFNVTGSVATSTGPRLLEQPPGLSELPAGVLIMPLRDGSTPIGWIELYLMPQACLDDDQVALLSTIADEISEAIVGARRRIREARAVYELEHAIAEERARIARDIHDGLAQNLAFLRLRADLWCDWINEDPARLRSELTTLKGTLREQIQELRRAIFALRPVQFDELGFVGGLHRYIVEFAEQQGWQVDIDLSGVPSTLSHDLEAICFRVIQEALTNAAKHARATQVKVTMTQLDGGVQVRVQDNGLGFALDGLTEKTPGHLGLRQMRERLATVQGQLTVLAHPGAGTELRAWVPLPPSA